MAEMKQASTIPTYYEVDLSAYEADFCADPASIRSESETRTVVPAPNSGRLHLQSPSGAGIYFADPDGCPRWTPDPAGYSKLFRD